MVQQQAAILRPETLIEEFRKNGVTHVVTIPDSETNYLYELMEGQDWLDIVPVSREGEAYGTAYGLNVAGKVPVVLIQNTGMMESGDSIRGMALDAGFPLVMVDRLPRLDAARSHQGLGRQVHRTIPERIWHQLLPRRAERRRRPDLHSLRGGSCEQGAGRGPGRRRVPRLQQIVQRISNSNPQGVHLD